MIFLHTISGVTNLGNIMVAIDTKDTFKIMKTFNNIGTKGRVSWKIIVSRIK
jgi:hypothetical protein